MKEKIERLIARFPDRESIITALSGSSARFRDLIRDHHDLHERLNRAETAADPLERTDLERRYRNLEEEMIRLMQGYPMA